MPKSACSSIAAGNSTVACTYGIRSSLQQPLLGSFDERSVINAAMDVFWRHGYAASSIDQLATAMGLSRSSLYKRFGDKEGLFREVMSSYIELVVCRMNGMRADTKREQLKALLLGFLPTEERQTRPPGCLLTRSCTEMADLPMGGQAIALAGLTQQHEIFRAIIREAIDTGEVVPTADVNGLAWHYLGVLQATMNLPQAGATVDEVRKIVDLGMLAWPAEQLLQRRDI